MDELIRKAISDAVDAEAGALRDLSLKIHANPELGLEETMAAGWLTEFLSERGFRVEAPVAGLETAFRATAGEGTPVCAFMSEYDALPEIGHGCGHNLIAIAGLGAGIGLKAAIGELGGTVQVLGTPGEEGMGGKVIMVAEGVFKDVDFAMMVHPSTNTREDPGCTAVQRVRIAFHGRTAHAAASPEKGANALDGIIQTYNGISAIRQHILEDSRIHGIITHGGVKPNIVPDFAEAIFYVRSPNQDYLEELLGKVERIAEGAARMTGTTYDFELTGHGYRARIPCPILNRLYREEAEQLGMEFKEIVRSGRGSSDCGDVSWVVPAIHPYFAIGPEEMAGHSKEFADHAAEDSSIASALVSAKAMALAAARVIEDAELLSEIKTGFDARARAGGEADGA